MPLSLLVNDCLKASSTTWSSMVDVGVFDLIRWRRFFIVLVEFDILNAYFSIMFDGDSFSTCPCLLIWCWLDRFRFLSLQFCKKDWQLLLYILSFALLLCLYIRQTDNLQLTIYKGPGRKYHDSFPKGLSRINGALIFACILFY